MTADSEAPYAFTATAAEVTGNRERSWQVTKEEVTLYGLDREWPGVCRYDGTFLTPLEEHIYLAGVPVYTRRNLFLSGNSHVVSRNRLGGRHQPPPSGARTSS